MRKREKERERHYIMLRFYLIEHANLQVAVMLTPGSDDK